jgi:shikimate dehydrogenase
VNVRRFAFIGVTTGSSSIMRIFPRWRDALALGTGVEIAGIDIPVGAPLERYRAVVGDLHADPTMLGALVTTHKIDVYSAADDLFEWLDELATLCGEVSCIAKRDGALLGWAKDPIAAGRSLEGLLDVRHFRDGGGHALCMGAGGSGTAIALYLATRRPDADHPRRLIVTDRSADRLEHLQATLDRVGAVAEIVETGDPGEHDRLLDALPPRSLVVNATGMGKDLPGSPLTPGARFPREAVVWELNYRGELEFLRQAHAQAVERDLTVEDGWSYFIHGWTSVMEEVFERPISDAELAVLANEAAAARPQPLEEK